MIQRIPPRHGRQELRHSARATWLLLACSAALAALPSALCASSRSPLARLQAPKVESSGASRKYILGYCLYGQVFHQVLCMRDYLNIAQALNRTLIVPTYGIAISRKRPRASSQLSSQLSRTYSFRWSTAVDWQRTQRCLAPSLGPDALVSLHDHLRRTKQQSVTVSHFECFRSGADDSAAVSFCYGGAEQSAEFQRLHGGSISLPGLSSVQQNALAHGAGGLTYADLVYSLRAVKDDVITLGELFNLGIRRDLPLAWAASKGCSNPWRPHAAVVEFVGGVVKDVLKNDYVAVHLKRESLAAEAISRGPGGVSAVALAAGETREMLRKLGAKRLYLATNLNPEAVLQYKQELQGIEVTTLKDVVGRTSWLRSQPWAQGALALEDSEQGMGLVLSLIERYICVWAKKFLGSPGSILSTEVNAFLRPLEHKQWGALGGSQSDAPRNARPTLLHPQVLEELLGLFSMPS